MDISSPENRFLEQGKSSELTACLQNIQETTADDGLKYSEKTCRDLARIIVCRSYASAVLELCHLVVGAVYSGSYDQRYEALFFASGAARSSNFKAYFVAFKEHHVAVQIGSREIEIGYADNPFAVTFGRMPLLSALMEFLMTAIGYGELDETLAPLINDMPTQKQVSEVANNLSRHVYAYLGNHLPPVQEQRKSQSFLQFVSDTAREELAVETISDDTVLDYWMAYSGGEVEDRSVDVKTYRSVFRMAGHLVRVLRYAADQYKMNGALPIGTNFDTGEIDPSDLDVVIAEIDQDTHPLSELDSIISSGVKFANKREMETLGEALHGDDVGSLLPLSVLRNAVFGDAQAALVQSLRTNKGSDMTHSISALPADDYAQRIQTYAKTSDHLEQMLLASFHVLARAGNRAAATVALALRPDLDVSELSPSTTEPDWDDTNVVSFQAEGAMGRFFDRIADDDKGELGQLAKSAQSAFKNISRQGFSDKDIGNDDIVEIFEQGSIALVILRKDLSRFLDDHTATIDWDRQISTDTPLFRAQFTTLYGDQNG